MKTAPKLRKWDSAEHIKTKEDAALYLKACLEEADDDAGFIFKAVGKVDSFLINNEHINEEYMIAIAKPALPKLITQSPIATIITTTKMLVDTLLIMNIRNRTPKQSHINILAKEMEAGSFMLTASGIGVSKTGVLLDGQNRLKANKLAGYPPIDVVLVTGLEDESQRCVDRHAKRNLADTLKLYMNMTVTTAMVAAVNSINSNGAARGKRDPFVIAGTRLTDLDVANYLAEYSEIISEMVSLSKNKNSTIIAALFVYAVHDEVNAKKFAEQVGTGVGLQDDDPAYRLRIAMDKMKNQNGASGRSELFSIAATACIKHARGEKTRLLRRSESWSEAPWKWNLTGPGSMA